MLNDMAIILGHIGCPYGLVYSGKNTLLAKKIIWQIIKVFHSVGAELVFRSSPVYLFRAILRNYSDQRSCALKKM